MSALDTALQLRIRVDAGDDPGDIESLHRQSALLHRLTAEPMLAPLAMTWRLVALSEIPFAEELSYTQDLIRRVIEELSTPFGFALSGKSEDILPCYNAMLVRALARLGYAHLPEIAAAVQWILQYQPLDRSWSTSWTGRGIQKYGGCLKATPCYLGLVKGVRALQAFRRAAPDHAPGAIDAAIRTGVESIFAHRLYQRMSCDQPVTRHITDVSFPESYHVNLLEVLSTVENHLGDHRCQPALEFLRSQRNRTSGMWKVTFRYSGLGWQAFDAKGEEAHWVTYLANRFLVRSGE